MKLKGIDSIPLIAKVDLLIVGGGITGIPAACMYAKCGKKVLVIEEDIFLGYEIGRWQRPWVNISDDDSEIIRQWFDVEDTKQNSTTINEKALHMDRYKRRLEDCCLDAGVEILYACRPVGCYKQNGNWQIIIGNKSGRQLIEASRIIDASETSIMATLVGLDNCYSAILKNQHMSSIIRRTIEFTEVIEGRGNTFTLPEEYGVLNNSVDIHQGAFSDNHVLIDIPFSIDSNCSRDLFNDVKIEYMARKKSLEIAAYILRTVPHFSKAKLGMGSLQVMYGESFDLAESLKHGIEIGKRLSDSECNAGECNIEDKIWITAGYAGYGLNNFNDSFRDLVKEESLDESVEYREISEFNKFHGFPERTVADIEIPVLESTEVLVVGGGNAGAVASRVAAETGIKTTLLEMNTALGGTATIGGVHYYWYGYRNAFTGQIDKRVEEWSRKLRYPEEQYFFGTKDSWSIEIKAFVYLEMCIEAGVEVLFNCTTIGTFMEGDKIRGVAIATPYGTAALMGKVTIDATGDGDVAAFAGADFIYGNERDRMAMWSSFAQYRAPGQYQGGNFATTMDVSDILDYNRFIRVGRRRGSSKLHDHGTYVTSRESRHVKGELVVTMMDQLLMRRFPDTVSLCFSNHDPKGRSTADIVYFGIIPPHLEIEIPYRVLLPEKIEHLLIAGKAISCTHDALAAIRMQDDIHQQGGAVGLAAALSIKNGVSPKKLNVKELQERLVEIGSIRPEMVEYTDKEIKPDYDRIISGLTGDEAFEWLEMELDKKAEEVSPIVVLCAAKSREIAPKLLKEFETADRKKKLFLGRLLLWHGRDEGLEPVTEEILEALNGSEQLPERKASVRWCQLYPDHGVMTEVTYLVNILARSKSKKVLPVFERLADLIFTDERNYRDTRKCMFNYIESIAYCAERLGFEEFQPILDRLLTLPELQNRVRRKEIEVDLLGERQAYLVICLSRALARCGSKKGLLKLVEFVEDNRLLLAKSALDELIFITGMNYGKDTEKWQIGLNKYADNFEPIPWTLKMD
jgi:flavin-dependent dehydrogenase